MSRHHLALIALAAAGLLMGHEAEAEEKEEWGRVECVDINRLAVFLGVTITGEQQTPFDVASWVVAPTIGLEYEWRLPVWDERLGIGLTAEVAFGEEAMEAVGLGAVYLHLWERFSVVAATGLHRDDGSNGLVLRGGAAYDFELGPIAVAPALAVDVIRSKEALTIGPVAGVELSVGF